VLLPLLPLLLLLLLLLLLPVGRSVGRRWARGVQVTVRGAAAVLPGPCRG
jgi:hypothetical protein